MIVRVSINRIILLLGICITFIVLSLPQVNAYTFQCEFERWDGEIIPCTQRNLATDDWPYKVTETTYLGTPIYKIRSDITREPYYIYLLRKPSKITYDFNPYRISTRINFDSKVDMVSNSEKHNNTVRYLNVTTIAGTFIKTKEGITTGPFFNDYNVNIYDSNTTPEYYTGNYQWKVINNELLLYIEADNPFWNDANYTNGIFIVFDSWIINSTEGWNGTFTQANLDANESVIINIDNSNSEPYTSLWTMDNFNATHIIDENQTSGNDCSIEGTATDAIGWRNRSRSLTGDDSGSYFECSSNPSLQPTTNLTILAWVNLNADAKQFHLVWGDWLAGDLAIHFGLNNNKVSLFLSETGADFDSLDGDTAIDTDRWYCVGATFAGGNFNIYLNGVPDATEKTSVAIPTINPSNTVKYIGATQVAGPNPNNEFNGEIDELLFDASRTWTQQQIADYCNNSFYSSGNFTTAERDAGAGNIITNVTVNLTLDGSSSVNIFLNGSNDAWATSEVQLVQTGAVSGTIYNTNGFRYYKIITELISGTTPHISQIEAGEGPDSTPPNITTQLPANESTFEQSGETVNIPFSVTCTDNVACDNATLHILNSTFNEINFTEVHFVNYFLLINGTGITGSPSDLDEDDGIYVTVQEAGPAQPATNCIDVFFNFTNVPTDHNHQITVDGRYTGGGAHVAKFSWFNFSSGAFVNFANFSKTAQDQSFTSVEINATEMVDGNGNATIKLTHDDGSCVSGHLMLIDLLELVATDNNKDFTDGFLNFTVSLSFQNETQYWYYFEAWDTSGNNNQFHLGNFTFNITVSGGIVTIIHPLNITYFAQNNIPIRLHIDEPELDTVKYSLDGGINVTITEETYSIFWPNTSLNAVDNGRHNLTVYINLTSTGENFSIVFFEVDFMGLNGTILAEAVWNHNATERTTNNYFDKVLGGDIMTNEILFFLVIFAGLMWLGFKTPGKLAIPFFGFAGLCCVALGLYINATEPFSSFGSDIPLVGQPNLLNRMAMWIFWGLSFIIPIYGIWTRYKK